MEIETKIGTNQKNVVTETASNPTSNPNIQEAVGNDLNNTSVADHNSSVIIDEDFLNDDPHFIKNDSEQLDNLDNQETANGYSNFISTVGTKEQQRIKSAAKGKKKNLLRPLSEDDDYLGYNIKITKNNNNYPGKFVKKYGYGQPVYD